MMTIKRNSSGVSDECYKDFVREYLDYVSKYHANLNAQAISELLRYSICSLLDLESTSNNSYIKSLSKNCISHLSPLVEKYNLRDKSVEYRMGFLEACVHCIEFSRKKINI